jgi:hypothetical protein
LYLPRLNSKVLEKYILPKLTQEEINLLSSTNRLHGKNDGGYLDLYSNKLKENI